MAFPTQFSVIEVYPKFHPVNRKGHNGVIIFIKERMMTEFEMQKNEYSGHCVAYTYEGDDPIYTRVEYKINYNPRKYVEETWPGNDNPHAMSEAVTLLIDPWARKTTIIKCLEEMIGKINSEGLFLGSWSHPDQGLFVFDDRERGFAEPI